VSNERKQKWTVIHVVERRRKVFFRHGKRRLKSLCSGYLNADSEIRLVRERKTADTGRVIEIGGHDGRYLICGLSKTIPLGEKFYDSLYVAHLEPAWFRPGDVLRIGMSAQFFRLNCILVDNLVKGH